MLIVNLVGGLGNQMFQYAFGRSLHHRRKLPVAFDTTDLLDRTPREHVTYRDFELGVFVGAVPIASAQEIALFKYQPVTLPERLQYRVLRRLRRASTYHESHYFQYDPQVWQTGPNTYFDGYWQTERYFHRCEALIRRDFTFRSDPTGQNLLLAQQIQAQNAVSVHVRRGDYVSNSLYNQVHGTCSPAYYEQAVRHMVAQVAEPVLYVFSDDPDWVRANMHFAAPTVYVAHNQGKDSFEDMRLMSLCQHHIIANSSFSWWGAWLNANPHKLVIAPRQWMQQEGPNSDLIPRTWMRL
ncbi:alpha-1,2-fucosyltransferase [Hymenobacter arcticus]